jgi:Superinfection immunity protein
MFIPAVKNTSNANDATHRGVKVELQLQLIGGLAALVAVAAAYYMPSIIAARRKHQREKSIAALNLLLGWTGVGWCAALAWAMLGAGRPTTPPEK